MKARQNYLGSDDEIALAELTQNFWSSISPFKVIVLGNSSSSSSLTRQICKLISKSHRDHRQDAGKPSTIY